MVPPGPLADNETESSFRRNDVLLELETTEALVGIGSHDPISKMYTLPSPRTTTDSQPAVAEEMLDSEIWHRRVAHMNSHDLTLVHNFADKFPKLSKLDHPCRACQLGKFHKLSFPGHFDRTSLVGGTLRSDIVGKLEMSYPDRFAMCNLFWMIIHITHFC